MATTKKQSYGYKPQKVPRTGPGRLKRAISRIERWNKIITLRLLGRLMGITPVSSPKPLSEVSSVLFIRYDALGDMIVTTPLWRILKRYKPDITIGVAGSYKNLGLLQHDPDVDVLYDYSAGSLQEFFTLSKTTRKTRWDVVFMCNFNQKTRNSLIAKLATRHGITATVGSANKEGHQALFSRLVALPMDYNMMPMAAQLQYLLRSTIALPSGDYERPSVAVGAEIERDVIIRLTEILTQEQRSKYILINTGAPEFKKWGLQNNLHLAHFISNTYSEYVVLLSSAPEDAEFIESELKKRSIGRVHYFKTSSILEMSMLVQYCFLLVTPDTSIVHLASAAGKPVVAFYLTTGEWLPFRTPGFILLPTKGEPISTIPIDITCNIVSTLIDRLQGDNQEPSLEIIHIDAPEVIEHRSLSDRIPI